MKQIFIALTMTLILVTNLAYSQLVDKTSDNQLSNLLGSTFSVTRCNSYTLPWGVTVTTSGTYTYTYRVSGGRDSVVTANVTINYSKTTTLNVAVCNTQLPYNFGGTLINTSGQYTRRLTTTAGCDSTIVLNLVVSTSTPTALVSTISSALVSNGCGGRVFRYTASSVTNAAAYAWTLPTSLGGVSGVIMDSGDVNFSRIIRVKYISSNAALSTDQIKVRAYSGCGTAGTKTQTLTHVKVLPPTAPASVTIARISDVCGARIYRYTAPALVGQTANNAPATGWRWTMPTGTLGSTGVLVAGTLTSQSIDIRYSSNAAASSTDIIRVCYNSSCGLGTNKSQQLNNTAKTIPPAPAGVSKTLISDVCGARVFRFTVTPVTGADGYSWLIPTSLGNITGVTIVGGDTANSTFVDLRFRSNLWSLSTDKIRVRSFNTCGYSLYAGFLLRIDAKTGCPSSSTKNNMISDLNQKEFNLSAYPNPSSNEFNITLQSLSHYKKMNLNIRDVQGRLLKSVEMKNNDVLQTGAELKSGVYFLEAYDGEIKKTIRLIKSSD